MQEMEDICYQENIHTAELLQPGHQRKNGCKSKYIIKSEGNLSVCVYRCVYTGVYMYRCVYV